MGGAAVSPSDKGKRKALDASINLVPFIDLLSCCISFLLITAVWTQLSAVDVTNQRSQGKGTEPPPREDVHLTLHLAPDGYLLERSTGEQVHIDRSLIVDGVYNTAMAHPISRGGRRGDYFEISPETMFDMPRPD